jgi:hypothetical protein
MKKYKVFCTRCSGHDSMMDIPEHLALDTYICDNCIDEMIALKKLENFIHQNDLYVEKYLTIFEAEELFVLNKELKGIKFPFKITDYQIKDTYSSGGLLDLFIDITQRYDTKTIYIIDYEEFTETLQEITPIYNKLGLPDIIAFRENQRKNRRDNRLGKNKK